MWCEFCAHGVHIYTSRGCEEVCVDVRKMARKMGGICKAAGISAAHRLSGRYRARSQLTSVLLKVKNVTMSWSATSDGPPRRCARRGRMSSPFDPTAILTVLDRHRVHYVLVGALPATGPSPTRPRPGQHHPAAAAPGSPAATPRTTATRRAQTVSGTGPGNAARPGQQQPRHQQRNDRRPGIFGPGDRHERAQRLRT